MTDRRSVYVIEFEPPEAPFTQSPRVMMDDRRLSLEARGALVWMAGKPKGWRLSAADAQESLGVGRDKWQRIVRELRAVGALERQSIRDEKGQIVAWRHRISWAPWMEPPADASTYLKTRHLDAQKPENPAPKAKLGPENPAPYKQRYNNTKGPENPASGETLPAWLSPQEAGRLRNIALLVNSASEIRRSHCTPTQAEKLVALGWVAREKFAGWRLDV